ncbi:MULTISPECIES: arabinose isomerase [Rhizobium/Agrobacterium group]|uniref:L-arabinose isomerase family protein n=1 Tax=Rhizobium/Agrobacterium group TaxID=227290 RepID=UPI001ADC65FF|nr:MULTISPECIES: arabinose isomerase [Rhizobium/Agrobacterium group]MBO9112449.1 arabinose isomerase [Agrobacterium sp. S2/73]QXZ75957.1 arabinose isomerase [Agrobacterium sp. S7/73]QYA17032.1 arabinose isomerase [Rhizobium sp. AB2/73]UEQ85395.1 arabinose isomerase [Rhizobium sp. AB2/73]
MIERPLKAGLFGIGLEAYWPQFKGLEARLRGYIDTVEAKLARPGVEVVNLGLIDTPEKALEAGHQFRQADVDIIFLYITTYALSSTVLPVARRAKVPVIILNLQPTAAIDYATFNALGDRTAMTGDWLAHCSACPVPEIANVFHRAGISFHQVTGVLTGDQIVDDEINDWIEAARVAHVMAHNRLGVMGRYYNGMLDIYSDLTAQAAAFGTHIEVLEIDELARLRNEVSETDVSACLAKIETEFDVQPDCEPKELERAAKTAVALRKLVDNKSLGSLAYYYESQPGHDYEDIISSVIVGCSMLTADGVPVAGEYEIKNAQAMKIMDSFGVGGSFTEYYAMDFAADVVLMGHDGPGHTKIAEGRTKIRPLQVYHGKVGSGVSVEMSVKHGPVTLLSVVESEGKIKLLCAEGASVAGPILEIGNTNSRYEFPLGARLFVEAWNAKGPAHHCAVGVGHIAQRIEKLGKLLDLEVVKIC